MGRYHLQGSLLQAEFEEVRKVVPRNKIMVFFKCKKNSFFVNICSTFVEIKQMHYTG